jgi:hypothetical protein
MNIPLDVELLAPKQEASPIFLSVGYGNAHIVIEVTGSNALEKLLAFIFEHRELKGAHWLEIGRFASCSATFTLSDDWLALVIDSNLTVDGFGQSSGLYIPRELLDDFTNALAREHRRFVEKPTT